jgi:hypothetical protein
MKTGRADMRRGFSRWDMILIVAAVVGIVMVILPQVARHRGCQRSPRIACSNNLKQVGLAFRLWALDNNDQFPMQVSVTNGGVMELAETGSAYAVFLVMSNELNTPKILLCPEESNARRVAATTFGGTRARGVIPFSPTNNLSYFVGLDADEMNPSRILSGDDHFAVAKQKPAPGLFLLPTNAPIVWRDERHRKAGNIGLADGSVLWIATSGLQTALIQTGLATNRLALP